MFCKPNIPSSVNLANNIRNPTVAVKNFIKKEAPAQVLSCGFCEIFRNRFSLNTSMDCSCNKNTRNPVYTSRTKTTVTASKKKQGGEKNERKIEILNYLKVFGNPNQSPHIG